MIASRSIACDSDGPKLEFAAIEGDGLSDGLLLDGCGWDLRGEWRAGWLFVIIEDSMSRLRGPIGEMFRDGLEDPGVKIWGYTSPDAPRPFRAGGVKGFWKSLWLGVIGDD